VFGLDLRSLALLRFTVGLLVILDLAMRSRDLVAHYTDEGVLPRSELLLNEPLSLSFYLTGGNWWFVAALFLITLLAAVAVSLGMHTRRSTLVCWLLLLALQMRNPLVLNSGDVILHLLLFWGFFLPWGAVWSWDTRDQEQPPPALATSWATAAYVIQIMTVYGFSVIWKSGEAWHNGTALYYTFHIDHFVRPLGSWLLHFPELLHFLSYAVYYFEASICLLLLFPWARGPIRTLTVFLLMIMHTAIALTIHLGAFGPIAVFFSIGLLPTWFWDQLEKRTSLSFPKPQENPAAKNGTERLDQFLATAALALVVSWNLCGLFFEEDQLPSAYKTVVKVLGLEQRWNMFSPYPLVNDGWFVVEGVLRNGKSVELSQGLDNLTWEKPPRVAETYRNQRWRKIMLTLQDSQFSQYRKTILRYFFYRWNQAHRGSWQVEKIRLYYVLERTPPPGGTFEHRRILLTEYPAR
jgi:vitamin K-dependent gamma-carboxylase-like protein